MRRWQLSFPLSTCSEHGRRTFPFPLLITLFSLVFLLSTPCGAIASWYLGGAFEHVELGNDFEDFDDAIGISLAGGFRLNPYFALDFALGGSGHDEEVLGVDADYSRFDMGAKFIFNDVSPVQPFVVAGLSTHYIQFDAFIDDIDGLGLFVGAGFEGFVSPVNSFGIVVKHHWWDGEDVFFSGDYDGTTLTVGVYFNYYFLEN